MAYFEPGFRPRRCFSKIHLGSTIRQMIFWITGSYGLDVGTFAPLTWLGAIFGANTLHLDGRQIRLSQDGGVLTFAARQTVHALAPRTTGGFLWRYRSAKQRGGSGTTDFAGVSGVERWD